MIDITEHYAQLMGVNSPWLIDDREERVWRHLDTMQFTTHLHCRVPRVRCSEHGVKTLNAPWASKNSRFTLLFEAFAIKLLLAARSIESATL
jgi:transposase